MKIRVAGAIAVLLTTALSARADGLQSAYAAVGGVLQGQLTSLYASCPKGTDNNVQYLTSALFVPISQTDSAVLINTAQCNGGNGAGQYLVMNLRGASRVITDARIGDMSFLALNAYFSDDTLTLLRQSLVAF